MKTTPVTFASPTAPAAYSWEATDEEVAARYGVPIESIARFDLNTAPQPPGLAASLLARGRFETQLSEYPPSDYRRLVAAAARRYGVGTDEILVGAGADEVLDVITKTFLREGAAAVIPIPTYAMYRVLTEQRGARMVAVPRLGPDEGHAIDVEAMRHAVRDEGALVVWLCSPNNPTALPEPDGRIDALLDGLAEDAAAGGGEPPIVVLDEAYAEFVGTSLVDRRTRHPNLIVVRTASKAYALAGLRVGFALAVPEVVARMNPYRPPGSVSTVSVTVVAEALLDGELAAANVARVIAERSRLQAALREAGWSVGESVTNFLLVRFPDAAGAGAAAEAMLRAGLVPRTFPEGHPLADHLRLTVRDPEQDDRLIAVARAVGGAR